MERGHVLQYDRLIIRIEPCPGPQRYEVFVEGDGGEAHGHFDLPFRGPDIENFVLRMSRGRGTRRVETSETTRAKEFGGQLFDALFREEVRDVYRSCLADARRQNRGLRVTLALTKAPELMDIPWEYLYDEPDFLAVSAWTPVVRYLDVARPRTPLAVSPPLRVLGMISNAVDMPMLDVEGERQRLEAALRPLRTQGRVEVHWTQAATLDSLLRKLHHGDFHILHFVGHGGYDEIREDGVLLLEGHDRTSQEITGERLGTILQDHHSLRLVVLNACEGARNSRSDPFAGVAASLVRRGIPAVVAMQFEITDAAALTFAAYFYEALAHGDPVDAAVAHARLGVFASGNDVEWGTPVLFLRSADGRAFELQGEQARSPEAELSLALEAHPTVAAVGEPITWSLHIANVGQPSLFRATPRDDTGRPLCDPVDLMSGEDAVFTWVSRAERGPTPTVSVIANEASGREVHAHAQARLDIEAPTPAMVLTLRPEPARAAPEKEVLWRLGIRNTGPLTLSNVVAQDAEGRELNPPVEVSPGDEREVCWTSPGGRTGNERVTVLANDSRGRTLSESAEATVSVVAPGSEAAPSPRGPPAATRRPAHDGDAGPRRAGQPLLGWLRQRRAPAIGILAAAASAIAVAVAVAVILLARASPSADNRSTTQSGPTVLAGEQLKGNLKRVPTNRVRGAGKAVVRLADTRLTVSVDTTRLFDGKHAVHIHAGAKGVCPPAAAARRHNGNLAISTRDGGPWYGPPLTSLTTSGDTSHKKSIIDFKRYKSGSNLRYRRGGIRVSSVVAALIREENAVIVVHGIDYNGNDIYDNAALDRSDLDRSFPGEETAPALCGPLVVQKPPVAGRQQSGQAPRTRRTQVLTASLTLQPGRGPSWLCHLGAPAEGDRAPA
jgi:CHAT domain